MFTYSLFHQVFQIISELVNAYCIHNTTISCTVTPYENTPKNLAKHLQPDLHALN